MGNIIHIPKPVAAFYPIKFGALYNHYAAVDLRNIANTGWHVPTKIEQQVLKDNIDLSGTYTSNTVGAKLKEIGTTYWGTSGGTNDFGFNARGAGWRSGVDGTFLSLNQFNFCWADGTYTHFTGNWYCTKLDKDNAIYNCNNVVASDYGVSIRLIKDSTSLSDGQSGTYIGNDGKIYRTICIGTQEWLADNLAETKFRNGDWIPGFDGGVYTPISNATWAALTTAAMCAYNDDWANV